MQLARMLESKNGFYGFNDSLLIRPYSRQTGPRGLAEWNALNFWKNIFEDGHGIRRAICFGEDLVGDQFCLTNEGVARFNPEDGTIEPLAADLEDFARVVLTDADYMLCRPLAAAWSEQRGAIKPGERLPPAIPFFLGGEYAESNLVSMEELSAITYRINFWLQTRNLPDGARVRIRVVD